MKSRHRSPRNALVIIAASEQDRFFDDALSWALDEFNLAMPMHLSKKQTVGWDHLSRRLLK
jgi:hypothetical protein